MALDVRAGFGQESLQDAPRRFLVMLLAGFAVVAFSLLRKSAA